jgi:hypothetical protein
MEISGMQGAADLQRIVAVINQQKKLMELVGAMAVKLIESSSVPVSSANTGSASSVGSRIDIKV